MTDEERAREIMRSHRERCPWDCLGIEAGIASALSAVRAEEREACAKIADGYGEVTDFDVRGTALCENVAKAIRGRTA